MSWPRKAISDLVLMATVFFLSACGVKGDPLPPEKPAELGRGRPTYKRATEDLQIRKSGAPRPSSKDSKEEGDDDESE
jgi:predicted small lipoprotein YifL